MGDIKEKNDKDFNEKLSFASYIWNSRSGEFCGRTPTSWGKILVFYIIFYLCLAAFWAIMLLIFSTTIDDKEPKWKLDESRIGSNPGLGFRPRPPKERIESTLIKFRRNNAKSYEHWVNDLTSFVESYTGANTSAGSYAGGADHPIDCETNTKTAEHQFCYFDVRKIKSECSASRMFGYSEGKPCILIKLNRIFDWEPVPYTYEDKDDSSLPEDLRTAITNMGNNLKHPVVYITCGGQNPIDKENIGKIDYFPSQGITTHYFPFRNQDNYRSPFVFVRFASPSPGMILNVECKAWAKNIRHNIHEKEGSVHFELTVE